MIQVLGRDLVMVPKLIHPLPPNEPRTPRSGDDDDIEEEPPTPHPLNDTWMQASSSKPFVTWSQPLYTLLASHTNMLNAMRATCGCCPLLFNVCPRASELKSTYEIAPSCTLWWKASKSMVTPGFASAQTINDERPPTPPRGRPPTASQFFSED